MSRAWMLPRLLVACQKPATVLEIATRLGTSVPSAASLAVRYSRSGHLLVIGERKTAVHARPAKIYQTTERP